MSAVKLNWRYAQERAKKTKMTNSTARCQTEFWINKNHPKHFSAAWIFQKWFKQFLFSAAWLKKWRGLDRRSKSERHDRQISKGINSFIKCEFSITFTTWTGLCSGRRLHGTREPVNVGDCVSNYLAICIYIENHPGIKNMKKEKLWNIVDLNNYYI